jgi:hypothetical protein
LLTFGGTLGGSRGNIPRGRSTGKLSSPPTGPQKKTQKKISALEAAHSSSKGSQAYQPPCGPLRKRFSRLSLVSQPPPEPHTNPPPARHPTGNRPRPHAVQCCDVDDGSSPVPQRKKRLRKKQKTNNLLQPPPALGAE